MTVPEAVPAGRTSDLIVHAEGWVRDRPGAVACQTTGRRATAVTYAGMADSVDRAVEFLARAGLRPGMRTALLVPPGERLMTLALALLKAGAVPVMVDPGLPPAAIRRCLDQAAPEAFVAIPLAHAARLLLGWARRSVRVPVTIGSRWRPGDRTAGAAPPWPPATPDDLALIAYTSGSTGPAKGVPLRHRHLAAQLDLLAPLGVFRAGTPMLSTFVPFTLGAVALGATAVMSAAVDPRRPAKADPAALAGDIARHRVAGLFASPALLDRLARHCLARGRVLETLDDVVVAGAPLPLPTLERLRRCLRGDARVLSVYGATECLPVAAIEGRDLAATAAATASGTGTCLGAPLPGVQVRIIPVGDGPVERWRDDLALPPGTTGEIVVASPAVAEPYLDDPRATALARIADGERTWHRMGDLGHLDEQGRLWFAGRRSERVRASGGDLYTDQVEPVFARLPGVRRTALVGVGPPGAQRPVLVVEREPGHRRADVRSAVLGEAARHAHPAGVRDVLFRRGFPVDARHNSKIRRGVLAAWAARRLRGRRR